MAVIADMISYGHDMGFDMRFTRLVAAGATVTVLGVTAWAPAQAAHATDAETQGKSVRLKSTSNLLQEVWASGGLKKSVVSWYVSQPNPGTTGYRVEARRNKGVYRTVKTVNRADAGRTVVRNLRKGNYRFRVRALNGSTAGPAEVAWATVRVRSRKLPTRFYTFRSRKDSIHYMTLRVISDRTVHGTDWWDMPTEYAVLVGRLYRARIKGKKYVYQPSKWRKATTGRWSNLRLKGYDRVKKSKTLSGHKRADLFRREMREGFIPRN